MTLADPHPASSTGTPVVPSPQLTPSRSKHASTDNIHHHRRRDRLCVIPERTPAGGYRKLSRCKVESSLVGCRRRAARRTRKPCTFFDTCRSRRRSAASERRSRTSEHDAETLCPGPPSSRTSTILYPPHYRPRPPHRDITRERAGTAPSGSARVFAQRCGRRRDVGVRGEMVM